MIQRIQTIFLLLVALCMGLMFGFPVWEKISLAQNQAVQVDAYQLTHYTFTGTNNDVVAEVLHKNSLWYIALLAGLSVIVALFAIFQYRNRTLQIKLGALNALLIGGTLIACTLATFQGDKLIANAEGEGHYMTGFWLPAAALFFNLLANRFIRRDELLVRSADRFR